MKALVWIVLAACGRVGFDGLGDSGAGPQQPDGSVIDGPVAPVGPIAFVQAKGDSYNTAATGTLAWPAPVVAGNLLLVGIDYDNLTTKPTVSDALGSTWTLTSPSDGFDRQYLAYAFAPASGIDAVSVTLGAAPATFFELRVHEYSGIGSLGPVAVNNGDTMPATVAITTTAANQFVFAMTIIAAATSGDAGPGFTLRLDYANDVTEDRLVDTPATIDAQTTYGAFSQWTMTALVLSPG